MAGKQKMNERCLMRHHRVCMNTYKEIVSNGLFNQGINVIAPAAGAVCGGYGMDHVYPADWFGRNFSTAKHSDDACLCNRYLYHGTDNEATGANRYLRCPSIYCTGNPYDSMCGAPPFPYKEHLFHYRLGCTVSARIQPVDFSSIFIG